MTMFRKVMPASIKALGDDEVEITISTGQLARDGHILDPQGCILDNYRANPIILWQHDPSYPVGRAEDIRIAGDKIVARARFAPTGISPKADEIRGLVKSGIVSGVSVGWDPIETEPLDPSKPRGGQRFTAWDMLECSFCAIPVDTEAMVTARAEKAADWKVGAARDLAIEDSDSWDGPAAEKSIFEHAGGDDFDPAKARKGFLVYNAADPKKRGSYKLPIAHAVDGALKVPKGAIRAAASRLPQTDIPDDVKKSAEGVLNHYKEKAGIGEDKAKDGDRSFKAKHARALASAPKVPVFRRGLGDVAQLCYITHQLGYAHAAADYETQIEGDKSQVPAMLGEALAALGAALIAMTEEEVAELLAAKGLDLDVDNEDDIETRELPETDRAHIAAGKTPQARAWRRGIVLARAGRVLSTSNANRLETASGHLDRAMKHHGTLGEHQDAAKGHLDAITATQEKAVMAHEKLGRALTAANEEKGSEPGNADYLDGAMKHHAVLRDHLDAMGERCRSLGDTHEDGGDAKNAMGRAVIASKRCVRAVIDGSTPGEDSDSKLVQKSGGASEDEGSRSLDFRRRQADVLALSQPGTLQ